MKTVSMCAREKPYILLIGLELRRGTAEFQGAFLCV